MPTVKVRKVQDRFTLLRQLPGHSATFVPDKSAKVCTSPEEIGKVIVTRYAGTGFDIIFEGLDDEEQYAILSMVKRVKGSRKFESGYRF
jgi:hypothetical protein